MGLLKRQLNVCCVSCSLYSQNFILKVVFLFLSSLVLTEATGKLKKQYKKNRPKKLIIY